MPGIVDSEPDGPPEPVDPDQPGTTHAAYGAGRPRLVLGNDGWVWESQGQRSFALAGEVTTIGSSPDAHVRLEGIAPVHAEIRHDERDDYVLHLLAEGTAPTVAGGDNVARPGDQPLHHGATFTVGQWSLTFERDERADHGRPYGGRDGGEFSDQVAQPARPDYRAEHDQALEADGTQTQGDQAGGP